MVLIDSQKDAGNNNLYTTGHVSVCEYLIESVELMSMHVTSTKSNRYTSLLKVDTLKFVST